MRRILGLFVAGLFMVTLSACGGGGASKASYCNKIKDLASNSVNLETLFRDAFTGSDPKKLDEANALVQDLAGKAPSDIKADAKTLADTVKKAVDAIKAAGDDTTKKLAALAPLVADQSKLEDAIQRINAYTQTQCGITLPGAEASDLSSLSSSASSASPSSEKSSSSSSSDDLSFDTDAIDSSLSSFSSALSELSSDATPN